MHHHYRARGRCPLTSADRGRMLASRQSLVIWGVSDQPRNASDRNASDGCLLWGRGVFVPAGVVVGPTCARRGPLGRACRRCNRPRRFARRSPRRPGPHADPAAPSPLPVCSAFARGGRALGLLPARHLPRSRRGGDLRSGLPPGALARCWTGAASGAGARAECLPGAWRSSAAPAMRSALCLAGKA